MLTSAAAEPGTALIREEAPLPDSRHATRPTPEFPRALARGAVVDHQPVRGVQFTKEEAS